MSTIGKLESNHNDLDPENMDWSSMNADQRAKIHARVAASVEAKYVEVLGKMRRTESKSQVKKFIKKKIAEEQKIIKKKHQENTDAQDVIVSLSKKRRKTSNAAPSFGNREQKKLLREANQIAAKNSLTIAIDMGFVSESTPLQSRASLMKQIGEIYQHNSRAAHPANIVLCGVSQFLREEFKERYALQAWIDQGLFSVKENQLEELIPQEEIVYLSSDAKHELHEIDPAATYVIGGILDHNSKKGMTLEKATSLGARCAKLPLDDYISRKRSPTCRRVLTCNAVAQTILDFHVSKNWDFTLDRNLPCRRNREEKKEEATSADLMTCASWKSSTDLKPKLAVVLGASAGIGFEFAKELRRRGWSIVMCARDRFRLEHQAEKLRNEVFPVASANSSSALDPLVFTVPMDCSNRGDCLRTARAILSLNAAPCIDGIVACAGTFKWDDSDELATDSAYLQSQNLQTKTVAFQELLPLYGLNVRYFQGREKTFEFQISPPSSDKKKTDEQGADGGSHSKSSSLDIQSSKPFFICIGSEAGTPGFSDRTSNTENETSYIKSMQDVRRWTDIARQQISLHVPRFRLELLEPPLLSSEMALQEFKRVDIDWKNIQSPEAYVIDFCDNFFGAPAAKCK